MANDVQFGNLVKNNAKAQEYQEKLKSAAESVETRPASGSVSAGSVTEQSTGGIQNQSQFNVNDASIFGDNGVAVQDFSQMWMETASFEDLSIEKQNAVKAQNELLSAMADLDGDGMITQDEALNLDIIGKDGVISDEDIEAIYQSLGITQDEASLKDLIGAIDDILNDAKAEAEAESISHAVPKDSSGHGSLKTDQGTITFQEGKYYLDGKSCEYNEETGEIKVNTGATKSDAPGTYGYSYTLPDGRVIEPDKGKYYLNGQEVNFDPKSNSITYDTNPDFKVNHTGSASGTATAADGTKVQWQEGKYYVDGKRVNYNEKTGEITPYGKVEEAPENNPEPEEVTGICMDKTGVKQADDGTFYVEVEPYQGGKVFNDDGNMRYPNGSYWGIVTNAYPDATESEKQQIYEEIGKLNGFDWQTNVLHPGDKIQLPVVTRDDSGQLQFADSAGKPEDAKTAGADNPESEASHAIPKDSSGHGSIHTDQGTITFEYGKYYLNGQQVDYDEKTGNITYSGQTGTYGKSVSLPDGHSLVPDKGIYYLDGQKINPEDFENGVYSFTVDGKDYQFDRNTGNCTLATTPQDTAVKHNGSQSGTAVAANGQHVEWFQGKYYVDGKQVRYDEKTGVISEFDTSVHKDNSGHGSGIAADGSKVVFEYGKYYIGGKWVDYNEKTGMYKPHKT